MTNEEYFGIIASALNAVIDGCARYSQKNPNAKYTDSTGKELPISFAIDIARKHAKMLKEVASGEEADKNARTDD